MTPFSSLAEASIINFLQFITVIKSNSELGNKLPVKIVLSRCLKSVLYENRENLSTNLWHQRIQSNSIYWKFYLKLRSEICTLHFFKKRHSRLRDPILQKILVMGKRAAGFLIYRLVSSQIEYLLLKASYGDFHFSPPKGRSGLFLPHSSQFNCDNNSQGTSILVKMITLQQFEKHEKRLGIPIKI